MLEGCIIKSTSVDFPDNTRVHAKDTITGSPSVEAAIISHLSLALLPLFNKNVAQPQNKQANTTQVAGIPKTG